MTSHDIEKANRPARQYATRQRAPQSGPLLTIDQPWPWESRPRSWRGVRTVTAMAVPIVMALAMLARCAEPAHAAAPELGGASRQQITCTAQDGDTLHCTGTGINVRRGHESIRLLAIDAPELHGCRRGRLCVDGDPVASRASLQAALNTARRLGHPILIVRHGQDRYGRTLAIVRAGPVNLSCHQLRAGQAEYVARWGKGQRVGRECR